MDIAGRTVLILGGAGLVGMAVARKLLELDAARVVVGGLTQREAEEAVASLRAEYPGGPTLEAVWGDIFLPEAIKDRRRRELLDDRDARGIVLDELYGDLTDEVLARSSLGSLLLRLRPQIIVDCVNTATAFAYQNVFSLANHLRDAAHAGTVTPDDVERLLATLYLPQLIRHVQIALEGMKRAGTELYLKVGTAGTGGMGLNIPFTHSEERPSRMLLAKSSIAGAQTLLLYLMARTAGAPTVKEVKPTAAISWKRIGFGEIRRSGSPIPCYDAVAPVAVADAFGNRGVVERVSAPTGGSLDGVYLDSGENGLFTLGEFEALTALGSMEYITPEEIAEDIVREMRGQPSGHDVVSALDGATMGPTYRAGAMREVALEMMETLERERGVDAVAFEMLGPPRLSKLLFEAHMLGRLYGNLDAAVSLDPHETAERTTSLIEEDADLRVRILSIGLPILLPDGQRLLRGPDVKCPPQAGSAPDVARLADTGWVDLRPANWEHWKARLNAIRDELERAPGPEFGSRSDYAPGDRRRRMRPGALAAWIFRNEDNGVRIKR